MTPDSVHLLVRSPQMTLFRDEQGRALRACYGPRLREPADALESAADAPPFFILPWRTPWRAFRIPVCMEYGILQSDGEREEAAFHWRDPSYPVQVEIHVSPVGSPVSSCNGR